MKKLITAMFALAMVVSMTVLSSCGAPSSAEIEKIIEKYDDDEELTPSDYNDLASYVEAAIDEVEPLFERMEKAKDNDDYDKAEEIRDQINDLNDKYEYYNKALRILRRADSDDLGSAKSYVKKVLKKERRFEAIY